MGNTTPLRRAIRTTFEPFAAQRGFETDRSQLPTFLTFRRRRDGVVQLVEIQWDTHGAPRFVVNFGVCSAEGLEIDGRRFSVEEVAAGWLSTGGRLKPGRAATTRGWFKQDRSWLQRVLGREPLRPAEEVVAELIDLFDEIELFFQTGRTGPRITLNGSLGGASWGAAGEAERPASAYVRAPLRASQRSAPRQRKPEFRACAPGRRVRGLNWLPSPSPAPGSN
jgi:hypothetical protein